MIMNRWAARLGALALSISLLAGCMPQERAPGEAAPVETAVPVPNGWVTYSSEALGFAISHPAELEEGDNSTYSRLFSPEGAEQAVNFIYVSAVPANFKSGGDVVYNYDPAEAGMLLAAQVGESVALYRAGNGGEAQAADPFTYKRVTDVFLAGQAAKSYVNDEPFEFPPGTQEIRIYLQTDDFIYLIGGYVDGTDSGAPGTISSALFNQAASTFRLLH